jgi:hypothetical protein
MFREFYDSALEQPILLSVVPLLSLPFLPRRRDFLSVCAWAFTVEILLDAWLTSSITPLAPPLARIVAIAFVVLGDFRVFFLTERATTERTKSSLVSLTLRSLGVSLVVPVLQAAIVALCPGAFADSRHTFLAYELGMLAWLLLYRLLVRRRTPPPASLKFSEQLLHFAVVYYALWAISDLWILSGSDTGYALRVLPNLLYYGFLVPFALWVAPEGGS